MLAPGAASMLASLQHARLKCNIGPAPAATRSREVRRIAGNWSHNHAIRTLNAMVMRAIAVALCAAGASGFMGMPSSTALRRCVLAARVARPTRRQSLSQLPALSRASLAPSIPATRVPRATVARTPAPRPARARRRHPRARRAIRAAARPQALRRTARAPEEDRRVVRDPG